jgi:hypothetical protein
MTSPKVKQLQDEVWDQIKQACADLDCLEKSAWNPNIPVVGGNVLADMLSRAAMIGAVGLGVNALVDSASAPVGTVRNQAGKALGYQKMLGTSPELQQMPSMHVKNMYDVLHNFAPDIAAQPTAAAGIVSNMAQYESVDHKTIQDLITMQKNYSETHRGQRREAPGIPARMMDVAARVFG